MDNQGKAALRSDIVDALDWWREAGVDCDFHDSATAWLAAAPSAEPERQKPLPPKRVAPETEAAAPLGLIAADALPQSLDMFTAWWMTEPALDHGRLGGRVAPRGAAGADLMVIVPEPEPEDAERLLSGPQGRLLDAMLAAMGIVSDRVYLASALPRHTPMADWDDLGARGFAHVLANHIGLAAPQRLLVFGQNVLPLLRNGPANNNTALTSFNHEGRYIPLLAGRSLAALLERPRWKAGFWQAWLDWSA